MAVLFFGTPLFPKDSHCLKGTKVIFPIVEHIRATYDLQGLLCPNNIKRPFTNKMAVVLVRTKESLIASDYLSTAE